MKHFANCNTTHVAQTAVPLWFPSMPNEQKKGLKERVAEHKNVFCTENVDYTVALHFV